MNHRKLSVSAMSVIMTALLSLAGNLAFAAPAPMTPELAAKKEMVRKQKEQQVTPAERKAAADWLKAERRKVYQAKQAALKSNPGNNK
jgi:hypothetical protein